jgi:Protein ENHANCED DISEASE RESISTANCE 2, C-terminal
VFYTDDESEDQYTIPEAVASRLVVPPAAETSQRRSRSLSLDGRRRSLTLSRQYWSNGTADVFVIRGPDYLSTGVKVAAAPPAFTLAGVDLFTVDAHHEHIAAHPASWLSRARAVHRGRSAAMPAMICLQWMNPHAPGRFARTSLSLYFTAADGATFAELVARGGPLAAVLRRFFASSDQERSRMLKIIPSLDQRSPALVRTFVPPRVPCLVGNSVRTITYCVPDAASPDYVEFDVDVGKSIIADRFFRHLFHRLCSRTVVDIALLLEGAREDELPEHILGVAHLEYVGPSLAVPLPHTIQHRGH